MPQLAALIPTPITDGTICKESGGTETKPRHSVGAAGCNILRAPPKHKQPEAQIDPYMEWRRRLTGGAPGAGRQELQPAITEATSFSSFTISAANFRMPSAVFSVAMASSFSSKRKDLSS